MCTVSWIHNGNGYQLLCNRDEKKTRGEALIPSVRKCRGVRYIAPQDGDFGGTWIATNEFGLTLALLNGPSRAVERERRSRGHLVVDLIREAFVAEVRAAIDYANLSDFAPFSLVALEPGRPAALFEWDGRDLVVLPNAEERMPLTSSSFDPEGVRASRVHEFGHQVRAALAAGKTVDSDLLFDFHRSHAHGPSAYSTCMHRPDAHTVSLTRVTVGESEAKLVYSPTAPCRWVQGEAIRLERVAVTAAAAR